MAGVNQLLLEKQLCNRFILCQLCVCGWICISGCVYVLVPLSKCVLVRVCTRMCVRVYMCVSSLRDCVGRERLI